MDAHSEYWQQQELPECHATTSNQVVELWAKDKCEIWVDCWLLTADSLIMLSAQQADCNEYVSSLLRSTVQGIYHLTELYSTQRLSLVSYWPINPPNVSDHTVQWYLPGGQNGFKRRVIVSMSTGLLKSIWVQETNRTKIVKLHPDLYVSDFLFYFFATMWTCV